VDDDVRHL
jgi:hypothetical protein